MVVPGSADIIRRELESPPPSMSHMQLREVVETSEAVAATRSRTAKIETIAGCLARMTPAELPAGAAFLAGGPRVRPAGWPAGPASWAGDPRKRLLGVGWASLRGVPPPAADPVLTVAEV